LPIKGLSDARLAGHSPDDLADPAG